MISLNFYTEGEGESLLADAQRTGFQKPRSLSFRFLPLLPCSCSQRDNWGYI